MKYELLSEETTAPAEDTPQPESAAGLEIDHFRVIRLLARGGMGEVYLARDILLGRKVALKLVAPELAGSHAMMEKFLVEARATAALSHPNIVTIHEVGDHQGRPYVALEYLEGETLADRIDERRRG